MFDNEIIVQSAVSAFNNAALFSPAFLWWAILALPLLWVAYAFAPVIAGRIGLTRENMCRKSALWTVILTFAWIIMFGGNYGVLRDQLSVLPFMMAAIVFIASLFLGSHTHKLTPPATQRGRIMRATIIMAIIIGLAASSMHTWWGPLLQIGAATLGVVLGRAAGREMRAVPGAILIMLATTTAILMQPEYFRFGQLGALTLAHMVGILAVGAAAAATIALRNINPRGRIHQSAYVKIKWMLRVISALAVALFILTESVPIFLGAIAAMFLMFATSAWHATTLDSNLGNKMFALTIGAFGLITVMPALIALAVICWVILPGDDTWRRARFLL